MQNKDLDSVSLWSKTTPRALPLKSLLMVITSQLDLRGFSFQIFLIFTIQLRSFFPFLLIKTAKKSFRDLEAAIDLV